MPTITAVDVIDVRFPTSVTQDGSDAMNADADYSAAYVIIRTDAPGVAGYGFTFTIGRGNDVCVLASRLRAATLVGLRVEAVVGDLGGTYRMLKSDSQLRWLGPDKGVEHLALAAVMNAVWDLAARLKGLPLWQFLASMSPPELVDTMDLTYLSDALTREDAIEILQSMGPSRDARLEHLSENGYPCYTTSAGWLGYADDRLRRLCREAVEAGYRDIKIKVGANHEDDVRRLTIVRDVIGPEINLMIDANQVWDVPEAIEKVRDLARFAPRWIEEPTSPDDVLGHAQIRRAVAPVAVATGEHGMNRVLFKQFFQADAIDVCQLDSARLASINEILPVYLMAHRFGVPVCPHAGGVGLCELVQHLSVFDYIAISGSLEGRVTEYVDHLHEHFEDPCIVDRGAYVVPRAPGYSAKMLDESVARFTYPDGEYWRELVGPAYATG
ncbi:enolase C-terminal domain-like protein [Microbacterium thalassium]|uniref:enolase C-terminal domain-like protein n=1 Tax=Microbacterium TaxID=33882 RepID=UPI00146CAF75|nr:enolase C-terminal domain-like protein [Microbacterium thalassium]